MKVENLPFLDAVRTLAESVGMQMPDNREQSDESQRLRQVVLNANRETARYFHSLLQSDEGKRAADYFSDRGLSRKTITDFGLGYSLDSWDGLLNHLTTLGFARGDLERSGLCVRSDRGGSLYDRFRG